MVKCGAHFIIGLPLTPDQATQVRLLPEGSWKYPLWRFQENPLVNFDILCLHHTKVQGAEQMEPIYNLPTSTEKHAFVQWVLEQFPDALCDKDSLQTFVFPFIKEEIWFD